MQVTHTLAGFLVMQQNSWEEKPSIVFREFEPHTTEYCTAAVIRPHSFEVQIDDQFDPTIQIIADLEKQKTAVRLKAAEDLSAIEERISKLSALPYRPQ